MLGTGGGGYNRINLAQAWTRVVQGLLSMALPGSNPGREPLNPVCGEPVPA